MASWISGAPGARAASASQTAGSTSQSTATSSAASSASARLVAITIATGSPCQRARSNASGYWGGERMPLKCASTATNGSTCGAISAPVSTATTPGTARAASASIPRIAACA